ncbi:MAG: hydroxyacid dehydrogenase [Rhodospirillaceae bacterium TMED8]|nr:hydroxyacid dehydrogenase [Magnetovibrio sp.]OUT50946.1 MAG: hydroxyacid dehydrogenase [Rhodospirillaceae bacterium TMED8]
MTSRHLHNTVMDQLVDKNTALDALRETVGSRGWLDTTEDLEGYVTEWRGLWRGQCDMVISPASTQEMSRVVAICADAKLPITPQSGNTGLVGGGVPHGGIVISTRRMSTVRAIDTVNNTISVEAGCILADIQIAADHAERLFPLSLAAEGSCRIGGNLSTNAGGIQVLRYGNARDLVLGLEVVLPDGRIWDGMTGLRKNNTGYDLKHLFIGAEGTLGVITAAVLKLFPKPKRRATAIVGARNVDNTLELFTRAQSDLGDMLSAFEYANQFSMEQVFKYSEGMNNPLSEVYPAYAFLELSNLRSDNSAQARLEETLAGALEDNIILDAALAQSEAQAKAFWSLREAIPEAQGHAGASIKHDVSVPISKVAEFIHHACELVTAELPGIRPSTFGHFGDGNIHFNLSQPEGMAPAEFLAKWNHFNKLVHDYVASLNGSFSAEHGIGELKIKDVERYNNSVGIDVMQTIKRALDPTNIMNPGKVLPDS